MVDGYISLMRVKRHPAPLTREMANIIEKQCSSQYHIRSMYKRKVYNSKKKKKEMYQIINMRYDI